jgi:hypothetical protein
MSEATSGSGDLLDVSMLQSRMSLRSSDNSAAGNVAWLVKLWLKFNNLQN